MFFINQKMKDKFYQLLANNVGSKYGETINNYIIDYINEMEQRYFETDEPLQEWLENNAVNIGFEIDTCGMSGYQITCAQTVIKDIWVFGEEFAQAVDSYYKNIGNNSQLQFNFDT